MAENTIHWDKDADGIVTLTLDDPTGSANVMNEHYAESMHSAVEKLVAEKDSITGVVITSAKKTFFAGGDLKGMIKLGPENAGEAFDTVESAEISASALAGPVVPCGVSYRSSWPRVPGSDSPTIQAVRLKFWPELVKDDCDAGTKPSETVKTCLSWLVPGNEYTWYWGAMRAGLVETS